AVKLSRSLRSQPAKPRQLLEELSATAVAFHEWSQRAGGRPPVTTPAARELSQAIEDFTTATRALQAYVALPDVSEMALYDLASVLRPLADDQTTPLRMARMHDLVTGLEADGFGRLLGELRQRSVPVDLWGPALECAVWESTVRQAQLRDGSLAAFNGRVLDGTVREFTRTDEQRTRVASSRVVRAHAVSAVNVMNGHPDQAALLRRQANLKTRHRSLRQVMAEAPDVAVAVKPCWMASPLSVSQLLSGGHAYFDVVIFDEASQVLPEDAVAALMRGRAAVVAGDPRQLPPTSFFASQTEDDGPPADGAPDDASGFESVLDLLSSVFRPWNLEWHYRSKDERLIAFSNEYIYNRRLVTFPGPGLVTPVRHVVVAKTSGDADEESSAAEVEAVAELVAEHAHRDAKEGTDRSLGVIAMGIKHARRIEARIEEMRRDDGALDTFLSRPGDERFFVKNLERVQGDERSSIILSIGYGKDASGRLPYRFGPLLQQGGERRLNVAITRASHEMTLVSSFDHLDMPPEKSKAVGVQLLRAYIEYMAGGGRSLVHEGTTPFEENVFERDVADALRSAGIDVIPQYGVSKYRLDMVTKHPRREGMLVLAIECDGATYHSAPTARDRDRLRQQHLEALGWRFCRIWSTDWFLNRRAEIDRVVAAHRQRLAELDAGAATMPSAPLPDNVLPLPPPPVAATRGPRPAFPSGQDIGLYSPAQLDAILQWVRSDGLLRTDEQLIQAAMEELGFRRRGSRIEAALTAAIRRTLRYA
ncbi:MAG: hypothetical protein QOE72_2019, partial [Chloroflexota bacterium]|nr:hypothetical protein [Chloroflexota bacterium]